MNIVITGSCQAEAGAAMSDSTNLDPHIMIETDILAIEEDVVPQNQKTLQTLVVLAGNVTKCTCGEDLQFYAQAAN